MTPNQNADACKASARSADRLSPIPLAKVPDAQGGVGAHLRGSEVRTYGGLRCAPMGCAGADLRGVQVRTYKVVGAHLRTVRIGDFMP